MHVHGGADPSSSSMDQLVVVSHVNLLPGNRYCNINNKIFCDKRTLQAKVVIRASETSFSEHGGAGRGTTRSGALVQVVGSPKNSEVEDGQFFVQSPYVSAGACLDKTYILDDGTQLCSGC